MAVAADISSGILFIQHPKKLCLLYSLEFLSQTLFVVSLQVKLHFGSAIEKRPIDKSWSHNLSLYHEDEDFGSSLILVVL